MTVQVLPARQFRLAQWRHFAGSVVLPTVAAVALPLALPVVQPLGWAMSVALCLGMWFLVGGVGVSVGLHRHFSHRSFEAAPALRALMAVLGSMAAQGPVIYWVALHRMHHAASDRPGDPHSPMPQAWQREGSAPAAWLAAWQGHVGWVMSHDVPKPTRYARDLLGDAVVRQVGRHYLACVAAGIALPAIIGWAYSGEWLGALAGAYWGGVLRIALGHHVIWAINSWCHLQGQRPHDTADTSTNVPALALLSWGESWHNHHHADPVSPRFGRGWREPDVGWWVVRGFVAAGWVKLRS